MVAHVDGGIVWIMSETVTSPQFGETCCHKLSGRDVMIAKPPPISLATKKPCHMVDHWIS